jgi:predicted short-subunit dehydrogenase-like oxidoreductase (DUF2520 family)
VLFAPGGNSPRHALKGFTITAALRRGAVTELIILLMLNFGVIGLGNLAESLIPVLKRQGKVLQIFSRDPLRAKLVAEKYDIPLHGTDYSELSPFLDVLFLTVRDEAIRAVAGRLKSMVAGGDTVVVHCSGAASLAELEDLGKKTGVFYPMQTASRTRAVDYSQSPIFLEGDDEVLKVLLPLARGISSWVYVMSSEQRLRVHVGAVFMSNFVNYFAQCAEQLVADFGLDHRIYLPLLQETVDKLHSLSPKAAQTGPARRGDRETILKHFSLLEKFDPELAGLYHAVSRRIMAMYRST